MIEFLDQLDQHFFLFLNGFHTPFMDKVMLVITHRDTWIPLYLFLIYLLYKKYKLSVWKWILGALLVVLLSDQTCSSIMKPTFQRPRPSHNEALAPQIHIPDGKGGAYGFASSHAANSFGVAVFLGLALFIDNKKWLYALLIWAGIVSYSRVYVGVHYPGDIIVGGIVGALFGWGVYVLLKRITSLNTTTQ